MSTCPCVVAFQCVPFKIKIRWTRRKEKLKSKFFFSRKHELQSDDFLIMFLQDWQHLHSGTENRKHCLFHMNVRLASENTEINRRGGICTYCAVGGVHTIPSFWLGYETSAFNANKSYSYISHAPFTWVYERGVHVYGICRNAAVDVPDLLRTTVLGYCPGSTNLFLISGRTVGRWRQSRDEHTLVG